MLCTGSTCPEGAEVANIPKRPLDFLNFEVGLLRVVFKSIGHLRGINLSSGWIIKDDCTSCL